MFMNLAGMLFMLFMSRFDEMRETGLSVALDSTCLPDSMRISVLDHCISSYMNCNQVKSFIFL